MSHTTGPWALGDKSGCGNFIEIDANGPEPHGGIATVVWRMEDDKEWNTNSPKCEANARLIAAAPDLLSALKQCLAQLEIVLPSSGLVYDERQALINAKAAIAKATNA